MDRRARPADSAPMPIHNDVAGHGEGEADATQSKRRRTQAVPSGSYGHSTGTVPTVRPRRMRRDDETSLLNAVNRLGAEMGRVADTTTSLDESMKSLLSYVKSIADSQRRVEGHQARAVDLLSALVSGDRPEGRTVGAVSSQFSEPDPHDDHTDERAYRQDPNGVGEPATEGLSRAPTEQSDRTSDEDPPPLSQLRQKRKRDSQGSESVGGSSRTPAAARARRSRPEGGTPSRFESTRANTDDASTNGYSNKPPYPKDASDSEYVPDTSEVDGHSSAEDSCGVDNAYEAVDARDSDGASVAY